MAVKIRMKRFGTKKKPVWRMCIFDTRKARDGKFIEELGMYDPMKKPPLVKLKKEKIQAWIKNGAKPTSQIQRLLKKEGII
jgi:small subunit ribosomal protein S16